MTKDIFNYYEYNSKLSAGGQPTEDQLEAISKEGFDAVINLSPVSTRNYLPTETELTESLGLDLVHFPVDCSNLQDKHYRVFSSIMKEFEDKKVFVHCGGNIKSSNLLHMYNVLESGIDEADSLKELKQIQQPEEKWFSYFKRMGMQGLS